MRTAELAAVLSVSTRTLRRYVAAGYFRQPARALRSGFRDWSREEAACAALVIKGRPLAELENERRQRKESETVT